MLGWVSRFGGFGLQKYIYRMQIVSPSYVEITKVIYEFWGRDKCILRFFTR